MEGTIDSAPNPPSFSSASSSFPRTPEEFDADPRVSFSRLDGKFILELDEEHEFEYDDALKRWVPVVRPPSSSFPSPVETEGFPFSSRHVVSFSSDGEKIF